MSNITYPTPALTFYAVYGAGKRVVVGGGAFEDRETVTNGVAREAIDDANGTLWLDLVHAAGLKANQVDGLYQLNGHAPISATEMWGDRFRPVRPVGKHATTQRLRPLTERLNKASNGRTARRILVAAENNLRANGPDALDRVSEAVSAALSSNLKELQESDLADAADALLQSLV
jgi:hypothetical protein